MRFIPPNEFAATGHGAFVRPTTAGRPVSVPNYSSHSGGVPSTLITGLPRLSASPIHSAPVFVIAPTSSGQAGRLVATPKQSAPISVTASQAQPFTASPINFPVETSVPLSPYQYNPIGAEPALSGIGVQPVTTVRPVKSSNPVNGLQLTQSYTRGSMGELLPLNQSQSTSMQGYGGTNLGQTLSQSLGSEMPLSYSYGPAGPFGIPVIGASENVVNS